MTDPRADPRVFDPRFDPAFQPGYEPGSDTSTAARSTPRRFDTAPPRQLTPPERVGGTSEYQSPAPIPSPENAPSLSTPSTFAPSPTTPSPIASRMRAAATSDDAASIEFGQEAETTDAPEPARVINPYTVTLWVVSVVLVAAGVMVFRSLPGIEQQGLMSTGNTPITSFGQVYSLAALAAILAGSGVLIAAGNLFVLAARWSNRLR